ncbi:MAG: hypothetical protein WCP35_07520 [Verrucomicrobiota bacterium]
MSNEQKEELRRLCLRWLAERAALAFNSSSIHRGVARDLACTLPEAEASLALLLEIGWLKEIPNKLGAIRYYQVSAAGTLAYERGE